MKKLLNVLDKNQKNKSPSPKKRRGKVCKCALIIGIHTALMLSTALATEKEQRDVSTPQSMELCVRKQGMTEFKFSIHTGKLIGEFTNRDGITQQLPIKGIRKEFQTDLNGPKIDSLQVMFDHCYFGSQGGDILVHARGLGGWNDLQHKGYDKPLIKTTYYWPAEGTYIWVRDILDYSFGERDDGTDASRKRARDIADACAAVDTGRRDPTSHFDGAAQSWHFNMNRDVPGGTAGDSRFRHAIQCLKLACLDGIHPLETDESLRQEFLSTTNGRGLGDPTFLGDALHPLQDVFAHTDAFSRSYRSDKINDGTPFYGHMVLKDPEQGLSSTNLDTALSFETDNPYYIDSGRGLSFLSSIASEAEYGLSQRYSDAKTASDILLYVYHLKNNPTLSLTSDSPIRTGILERIQQSLSLRLLPDFQARGTHGILGFIQALQQDPFFNFAKGALDVFKEPLTRVYQENTVGLSPFFPGVHIPIRISTSMAEIMALRETLGKLRDRKRSAILEETKRKQQ